MKIHNDNEKIINWLDTHLLSNVDISKDYSMNSRKSLIPHFVMDRLRPEFLFQMNGLATTHLPESIRDIFCVTFLSEEVVESICSAGIHEALLITHHFFDMSCGDPGQTNGVPFHFINENSFKFLLNNNNAIYSCHLPMDRQECFFNTSKSFALSLGMNKFEPLELSALPNVGYYSKLSSIVPALDREIFPFIVHYGHNDPVGKEIPTAIIAGVISNTEILDELERQGIQRLLCGDVLVRISSPRYEKMLDYLQKTSLSIYCFSHLLTERCALKMLANELHNVFPQVNTHYSQEKTTWK